MAETFTSSVSIQRSGTTNTTILLNANNGNIVMGNHGQDGDLAMLDGTGQNRINLDAQNHTIVFRTASGDVIAELGRNGNLRIGGQGHDGDIEAYNSSAQRTVHLDGQGGNLWLGGNGSDGDIILFPSGVANSNSTSNATIHLDGNAGDITLKNADAAEDFDVVGDDVEPGSVLVIDDGGALRCSRQAYDRRVAGVVSGAGPLRPGLVLDRQDRTEGRRPIALAGKVYVRADATRDAIDVGDLLTSADLPGHAMRAADPARAFGAVIGKALAPLRGDRGLVPILVALQ